MYKRNLRACSNTYASALPALWRGFRAAAGLLIAILFGCIGCATSYTPNVQLPPRLVLQPRADINLDIDLDCDFNAPEPLPFVKHSLAELEADEAAALRAHPEREALEANAAFQINTLLQKLDRL